MLGFIGTGNMASAIIRGVIASGLLGGEEIGVYDLQSEKAEMLSTEYGVKSFGSASALSENCDKIVLSVKPNVIAAVLSEIDGIAKERNPLFISIAAGKTLEFLSSAVTYDAKFVRVMPNINAVVLSAVSAFCTNENVSEEEKYFVEKLLSAFGTAVEIKEDLFSVFSAIAGCSPAFSYMYIDSLARGAVKNGMPRDMALKIAAAAVMGSAKMIMESDEHPWTLVDRVCSPGGTTIEGVTSLQENGFETAVINAVQASFDKDKRL